MTERTVREFPIRSVYYTQSEVQKLVESMDIAMRLVFSKGQDIEEIYDPREVTWDIMRTAYTSLLEVI